MKNKYLNILFLFAICCFSYQNANAQCTEATAGPYINFQGLIPCDDAGGACPFNELTLFEIWSEEGYLLDNVVAGTTYTISICNSAAGVGLGGQAWPAEFTINAPSGAIDGFGLNAGSSCELTFTATESGTYIIAIYETGACGTSTNTTGPDNGYLAITCTGTAAPCAPPACSANFDGPTSGCTGDVVFGAACSLDTEFLTDGNTAQFEIFYETDGTADTNPDGAGASIIDAVSDYTTGADILANLSSGAAGEVIFFGNPGDCSGLTSIFANLSCAPFTLSAFVATIEYNADGNPAAVNGDCPVERVTLVFNPDQASITVIETDGDCDNPATVQIGFDNGGSLDGSPDGDFDDDGDFLCSTLEAAAIPYPCGGTDNVSTVAALPAADLATLLSGTDLVADPSCYTDLTFTATATCPSAACPACDAIAPTLTAVAPECPDGTTVTLGVAVGSANAGEITEFIITDPSTGLITSVTPDATGDVAGLAVGEEICITSITHVQAELDQIIADLNTCTGGLVAAALALPATGNTLQAVFDGVNNSVLLGPATLTIDDVQALIGGVAGGTGPGLGGLADLSVLADGLMCPILPFCYNLSTTVCATGVDAPICDVSGCTNVCATNYNPAATVDDGSCTLPAEPATECYETATFNDATCVWDVTGTQDPEPATACYETATFNDATCAWDVTGTQDPEPATACYETATFNDMTCVWDVTGTQDPEPATACYETATFNDATCVWDVTGTQDPEPATECYQTATFNDATCAWDVTGTQPEIDDNCDLTTDTFDDATCMAVNTPNCPTATPNFDAATCTCTADPVEGCTDMTACNFDPNANTDDGSCVFAPVEPATECYETATLDNATCAWVITGEQDPEPATECYETATFDDATCAWVVSGTQDPEPTGLACYETAAFDDATCTWVVTGEQPVIDDNCEFTDDSFDGVTCMAVNTSNCPDGTNFDANNCACISEPVLGCTDPTACNFDANATEDDSSCVSATGCDVCDGAGGVTDNPEAGETCDDGDAGTVNDTVQTDCSCSGTPVMVDVEGCTDATACNFDAAATVDDGSCVLATGCDVCDGAGGVTDNPEAGEACNDGDPSTVNDTVQADCSCSGTPDMVDVEGCTDATACNFDANATVDDASCVFATGCDVCDGAGGVTDNPEAGTACDDNNDMTENDTIQGDCSCEGTPIMMGVPGCTNADACNFDAMATVDNGSCVLPGDSCNDGNPLTVNDIVQADCTCLGGVTGEPIPTVGQWGLIILALIMLNLGVLYIRQTDMTIVSE